MVRRHCLWVTQKTIALTRGYGFLLRICLTPKGLQLCGVVTHLVDWRKTRDRIFSLSVAPVRRHFGFSSWLGRTA